jgi:hypothetical protein
VKPFISFLLLASMLLLVGCSKGLDAEAVGKWSGPGGQVLELKQDKTFAVGTGMMSLAGKWSVKDEKTIGLNVDAIGGKPVKQALDDFTKMAGGMMNKERLEQEKKKATDQLNNLTLGYDKEKKTLTMTGGPGGQSATFTKQAS